MLLHLSYFHVNFLVIQACKAFVPRIGADDEPILALGIGFYGNTFGPSGDGGISSRVVGFGYVADDLHVFTTLCLVTFVKVEHISPLGVFAVVTVPAFR